MFRFFRIALFVLGITGLVIACIGGEETDTAVSNTSKAKRVETIAVEPIDFRESIFASGRLSSKEEARLSFKTGGIIKRILVKEGQSVRKGQLLAELDLQEIKAQTQQAVIGKEQSEISIEKAKLGLRLAERDYENALGLYKDSVATLEQLQNAEIQLDDAKNQLAAAQTGLRFSNQNIEVANFNLKYSKIVAPANGTILKKLAESNELVGPGTPVILFGSKDKAQVLKVNITDRDIIHVDLNNEAAVAFDAYPDKKFTGYVREIASMADPYTGTYEVEIEVMPDGNRLLSGFIGNVTIFTQANVALYQVPIDALIGANGQQGSVFLVEGGKAIKSTIGIYKIKDEQLLISRGLDTNDVVIISGVGYLEHEDSVFITAK